MRKLAPTALILATLGCGGAPPPPPAPPPQPAAPEPGSVEAHARGGSSASAVVGEAGGTLELNNGARVTIPAGALSEARELTFAEGAETQVFEREGTRALATPLSLSPAFETAPGTVVKVSIPQRALPQGYEDSDLALAVESPAARRALGMGDNRTRWENFPARRVGDRLEGELSVVPGMRFAFIVSR